MLIITKTCTNLIKYAPNTETPDMFLEFNLLYLCMCSLYLMYNVFFDTLACFFFILNLNRLLHVFNRQGS